MRALIFFLLALSAVPAAAQDSQDCVDFQWLETFTDDKGWLLTEAQFTNKCSWGIHVRFATNEFGKTTCRDMIDQFYLLTTGETELIKIIDHPPDDGAAINYCAQAAYQGHPDYKTCGMFPKTCN